MQLGLQLACHDGHSEREGTEHPEGDTARDQVGAEYGVGGVVGSVEEAVAVLGVQGGGDGDGDVRRGGGVG